MKKLILCAIVALVCAMCFSAGLSAGKRDVIINQSIVSEKLVEYDGNLYEYK